MKQRNIGMAVKLATSSLTMKDHLQWSRGSKVKDHYHPVEINNEIGVMEYHILSSNRQRVNVQINDVPYQQSPKNS